jgi:hypothetical protein
MALDLTLTIKADGTEAKRVLSDVEQGIQRVEGSSSKAAPAVSKVTAALKQNAEGTAQVNVASKQLDASTKAYENSALKAAQAIGLMNAGQVQTVKSASAMAGVVGLSTASMTLMAAAALGVVAAIGAMAGLLVKSIKHYFDTADATRDSRDALKQLADTFEYAQTIIGHAVLGGDFSIVKPINMLNTALIIAAVKAKETVNELKKLAGLIPGLGDGAASLFSKGEYQPDKTDYIKEVQAQTLALAGLTKEGKAQLDAALLLGKSQEIIKEKFGLTALGVQFYRGQLAAATEEKKEAARESERLRKDAEAEAKQFARSAQELVNSVRAEESALFKNEIALRQQFLALRASVEEKRQLLVLTDRLIPVYRTYAERIKATEDALKNAADTQANQWRAEQERASMVMAEATKQMQLDERAAWDLGRALGALGHYAGGMAGDIANAAGRVVDAFASIKDAQRDFSQIIRANWQQTAAYITSMATSIIGTVQAAAAFLERDTINGQRRNYLDQQGGAHALSARATTAGVSAKHLLTTDSASQFEFQMRRVNAAIEESEARLQRYGLTWRDLGQTVAKTNIEQMVRVLAGDYKSLTGLGADPSKTIKSMSGALNQLVIDATATGQKIPKALEPILKKLIEMGGLTEAAARAMLGMAEDTTPAWADVEAAAKRYGIQIDQLGPKVAQIRINDIASQIEKDWKIMTAAGADMGVVMNGMKAEVQGVVTEALMLGLAIPEGMRPVIDAMIAAGILTDEFGNKLNDASRITFQKPLVSAIEELTEALKGLIDHLSAVGTAAEEGFGRARGAAEAIGWAVPRGSVPAAEGTRMHAGGPIGPDELPIIAQAGEYMMPRSAVSKYGTGLMNSLRGGTFQSGGSGGAPIQIVLEQDSSRTAEWLVPAIPGMVKRLRLNQ